MKVIACKHPAVHYVSCHLVYDDVFVVSFLTSNDFLYLVSILGWVLIGILVLAEAKNYMTPKFKEHMIVDTSLGQQLRVNINITFHSLTCNEVRSKRSPAEFNVYPKHMNDNTGAS